MIIKVRGKENSYWHLFDKVNDLSYKNIGSLGSNLNNANLQKKIENQNVVKILKENGSDDDTYYLQFLKEKEGYNLFFNTYGFVMNDSGETIEKIGEKSSDDDNTTDSMTFRLQQLAGIKDNDPQEYEKTKKDTINNGVNDFRSRKLDSIKEDIQEVRKMSESYNQSDIEEFIDQKTSGNRQTDIFRSDNIDTPQNLEDFFDENNIDPVDHKISEFTSNFNSGVEKAKMFWNIPEDDITEEMREKINKFYDKGAEESNNPEDLVDSNLRNPGDPGVEASEPFPDEEEFLNKNHGSFYPHKEDENSVDLNDFASDQETKDEPESTERVTFEFDSEDRSDEYETLKQRIAYAERLRQKLDNEESEITDEIVERFVEKTKKEDENFGLEDVEHVEKYIESLDEEEAEEDSSYYDHKHFVKDNIFDLPEEDLEKTKEKFKRVAGIDDEEAEEAAEKLNEFRESLDEGLQEHRDEAAERIAENVRKAQEKVSKEDLKIWLEEKDNRVLKVYPGDKDVEGVESASFNDWKELKSWCEGNGYDIQDLVFTDLSENIQPVTLEKSGTKRVVFGTEPGFEYKKDDN